MDVLLADVVYRHPGAVPVEVDGGWAVQLAGPSEGVTPAGVQQDPYGTHARPLRVTLSLGSKTCV